MNLPPMPNSLQSKQKINLKSALDVFDNKSRVPIEASPDAIDYMGNNASI